MPPAWVIVILLAFAPFVLIAIDITHSEADGTVATVSRANARVTPQLLKFRVYASVLLILVLQS